MSTAVTAEHVKLFARADRLLARMTVEPTLQSVTAAYLSESDRVKELEAELKLIKQLH